MLTRKSRFSLLGINVAEIAIADLGQFQIVMPTTAPVFSSPLTVPNSAYYRKHDSEGWVIYQQEIVGVVKQLQIDVVTDADGVFQPSRGLGPAVPLSFEIRSYDPLPSPVGAIAEFACQISSDLFPFCAVFRRQQARFVKVYSVRNARSRTVLKRVKQFLHEEAQFIENNRDYLKNVPFYREKFNLR